MLNPIYLIYEWSFILIMNGDREFILKPFNISESNSNINITVNIVKNNNKLNLEYLLEGDLSKIIIPSLVTIPRRKNELWQTTCFEFFLGIKESPQYWEFNLSPAGDWNIYRFTNYRYGMVEETAWTSLPFKVRQTTNSLNINLEINLDTIIDLDTDLEIAISAVIEYRDRSIDYWALTHPKTTADFHDRDSFIIDLF